MHRHISDELRHRAIGVALHYIRVYLLRYYGEFALFSDHCPAARGCVNEVTTLALYPRPMDAQHDQLARTPRKVLI